MNSTNFIENKYKKWYFSIIENAKNRTYIHSKYEKHHIIPSSLGGNNSRDNIVLLTFREHFICHHFNNCKVLKEHNLGNRKQ